MTAKQRLGHWLLRATGWKMEGELPCQTRFVMAIFPHTSMLDFLVGKVCNLRLGYPVTFMIKKEAFFFPVGPLLRRLGGVPVDRANPTATIMQTAARLRRSPTFALVIAPEGTRAKVKRWKGGFWYFAREAGVPVVPVGLDYHRRTVRIGAARPTTDDREADIAALKNDFAAMRLSGLHNDRYTL